MKNGEQGHGDVLSSAPGRVHIASVLSLTILAGMLGAGGGWWYGQHGRATMIPAADKETDVWYTCGMHPQVRKKGPGDCPICHMKLTPIKPDQESTGNQHAGQAKERQVLYWRDPLDPKLTSDRPGRNPAGEELVPVYGDPIASTGTIRIDPTTVQNMGVRTAAVQRGPLVKALRTVGRVDYDEELVAYVQPKFEGWVEKLHVSRTGQYVRKGQPLFDVYSRELYSAQEEYLVALRGQKRVTSAPAGLRPQSDRLMEAARTKLRFLDVPDEQIEELERAEKIQKTVTILSPAQGIVTDKMVKEGAYLMPGMKLYTIADLSRVWVLVDVYEYQLPWVRVGQTATVQLAYVPGKQFTGQLVYIYPYLEKETRVVKVRLEFENPTGELKPDMYVSITLAADMNRTALLVPREAYIDSGTRKVAFVDTGEGRFQPRDIRVGVESESGLVEVIEGLDEGERVVTSGQFLLDAESKLREATAKLSRPATPAPFDQHATRTDLASVATQPTPGIPENARYACPMDEHPDETDPARQGAYFSAEPGECPWCGMDLEPIEELAWARARKAAAGAAVAYTCPRHPNVLSFEPGECPRCGRELAAFKLAYSCPQPEHADITSPRPGRCPRCGQGLVAYRGPWLEPPPSFAGDTIASRPAVTDEYRCPMHPEEVRGNGPGICSICAMQLVPAAQLKQPGDAVERVQRELDHITEHYLSLQELLAADKTLDASRHALGMAGASEELLKALDDYGSPHREAIEAAARKLHAAVLKINGLKLSDDRVRFVALSDAYIALLDHVRPDRRRWPALRVFHCPMSKGDWVQTATEKMNPYYGSEMLRCGELKTTR